ncbi:glioma pathogenesis-related protein 1 [Macrotis lagotis]|uniref:glioma pathogenesis-related protein 1 n=1 Tax=Macrotis lagotis TaxID=92651 RepID=UPI003D695A53
MDMNSWFGVMLFSVFSICNWAQKMNTLPNIENEDFIKKCVDIHNKFRSQVVPRASNMLHMSWDTQLAKVAEAWAKKCKFQHNSDLKTPKKLHPTFNTLGENIWVGSSWIFSEESAIKLWNDEVKNYNFETQKCTGPCLHYTQVVWANSYKVGCAVQFCPKIDDMTNAALFVCDYGPPGNFVNEKPYKKGEPCSACKKEDVCVNQMCANPDRDRVLDKSNRIRRTSLAFILAPLFIILPIIMTILIKHYHKRSPVPQGK